MKSLNKKTLSLLIVAGVVLLILLVLAYFSFRYTAGFLSGTVVNGVECSGKTPAETAILLKHSAAEAVFTLEDEKGGTVVTLPLTSLMDVSGLAGRLETLLAEQHQGLGVLGWISWQGGDEHIPLLQELNETALAELIRDTYYSQAEHRSPVDSTITVTTTGYKVTAEDDGHEIRSKVCAADALPVLLQLTDAQDVTAVTEKGVTRALLPVDGEIRTEQTDALDAYLNMQLSVDFGNGNVITLTPEQIREISDITIEGRSVICTPIPERVNALASELCDTYADDGVYAKFRNVAKTRELVYYRVGDTGWRLDKDGLGSRLCEALSAGEDAIVEPAYDYTWYWLEQYPYNFYIGELTYVEISLDNQYMWFYKDGELLVETPVVTGCIASYDYTNRGFFRIAYKEEDCMLTGPTWNDHVDYWMPFDGNIGMHDSSWRDEYGGDIYLENGSHGCINTPLEAMSIIYNNIDAKGVIIVY